MYVYFFSGGSYIRVERGDTGAGSIDPGYPESIAQWNWPSGFGTNGIDAALYSGSMCYFFKGPFYISVSRPGNVGAGTVVGPISPISDWGWPDGFGANGIDAALWSGPVCYFFSGREYIRVTRGDVGPGVVNEGYPKLISDVWGWGAFGANGIKGALPSGSKCYFFSGTEYIRVSRGIELPGLMDPGYPAPITNWNWGAFGENGIDAALYSGGPLVSPPSQGLGSNFNYFLASGDEVLTGLSVTINIDNDLVSTSGGFGFQMNTYSQESSNASALYPNWQQYLVFAYGGGNQLVAMVNNYYGTYPGHNMTQLINTKVPFANLSSVDVLKAGSSINITLQNDANGNVTGCVYTYTDPTGQTSSTIITLMDQYVVGTNQKISSSEIAPVVALTLNVVGSLDDADAILTSAEGSITYSADQLLTPQSTEPSYTVFDDGTGETGNTTYAQMPMYSSNPVSQIWGITPPPVPGAAPKMMKKGRWLPAQRHLATKAANPEQQNVSTAQELTNGVE